MKIIMSKGGHQHVFAPHSHLSCHNLSYKGFGGGNGTRGACQTTIIFLGAMLHAQNYPNSYWSRSFFAQITVPQEFIGTFLQPTASQVGGILVLSDLHG